MESENVNANGAQNSDVVRPAELDDDAGAAKAILMEELHREREMYATRVKARLAAAQVTEIECRDGIRDCFVATYLGGVAQGLENFSIRGDVHQVRGVVEAIFRRRLKMHGTTWETPSVEALEAVKDEIDREVHFDALPAELKNIHDQVCTLLLGKVRGDIGHVGNRSAVAAHARGEIPTVPAAAPPAAAAPAVPVAVPQSAPVAVQSEVRPERPPSSSTIPQPADDPVVAQMRTTVATMLEQMAREARSGADVDELFERAGQLAGLIETLRQLSEVRRR